MPCLCSSVCAWKLPGIPGLLWCPAFNSSLSVNVFQGPPDLSGWLWPVAPLCIFFCQRVFHRQGSQFEGNCVIRTRLMTTCRQLPGDDIITIHHMAQCFSNLILFSQLSSSLRYKTTEGTKSSPSPSYEGARLIDN